MKLLLVAVVIAFSNTLTKGNDLHPKDFYHFPDLNAIKSYFRNEKDPYAKMILETFDRQCTFPEDGKVSNRTRKPFIVVEGNHRGSREIIAKKLARRMNARYLTNLAPCLFELFHYLSHGSVIRRVFYLLSVYASAFEARSILNMGKAVVINGYWWEQVTYSLLQALRGATPPPISSPIFQSPMDLLQPDLTIYVNLPDTPDPARQPNPLKQLSVGMYKNLSTKYPIMIMSMSEFYRLAIDRVYENIRQNLSEQRDFSFTPWTTFLTTTPDYLDTSSSES